MYLGRVHLFNTLILKYLIIVYSINIPILLIEIYMFCIDVFNNYIILL